MSRAIKFCLHFALAISMAWPLWLLAMDSAFGGLDDTSLLFITLFATNIVVLISLALGTALLLRRPMPPRYLIAGGPFLACVFLTAFAIAQLPGLILIIPLLVLSLVALVVDLKTTISGVSSQWPQ